VRTAFDLTRHCLDDRVVLKLVLDGGLRRRRERAVDRFLLEVHGDLGHVILPFSLGFFALRSERLGGDFLRFSRFSRCRFGPLLFTFALAKTVHLGLHEREFSAEARHVLSLVGHPA
jgi:hypothetical protein